MMLFMSPAHAVNFWVCGLFCLVYFIANVISARVFFYDTWARLEDDIYWSIALTNLYSIALSLPLMPFIYVHAGMVFPVTIISLFALSNFIWQLLFVNVYYKIKWYDLFLSLSLSNLLAWIAMAAMNYHFYGSAARWIEAFFIQ